MQLDLDLPSQAPSVHFIKNQAASLITPCLQLGHRNGMELEGYIASLRAKGLSLEKNRRENQSNKGRSQNYTERRWKFNPRKRGQRKTEGSEGEHQNQDELTQ